MENMSFNNRQFIKSLVIFTLLMSVWTISCLITNNFTENDKGFVTGFGFLVIFSASIHFGQKKCSLTKFFHLLILMILLYSSSSFILSACIFALTDSYVIYTIFNSIFVSVVLTLILDKLYTVELKKQTILLSLLFIMGSYFFHEILSKYLYSLIDLHPGISIFIFFQSFVIIPVLLGLTLKKKASV